MPKWFTWPDPAKAKTDDYFAAKGKALVAGTFDRSTDQTDSFNLNEDEKGHYARLKAAGAQPPSIASSSRWTWSGHRRKAV